MKAMKTEARAAALFLITHVEKPLPLLIDLARET